VTAGEAAVYAQANDERDFAVALADLIGDPSRRKEMGTCGIRRVEAELEWEHSIPNLLDAYAAALEEPAESGGVTLEGEAPARQSRGGGT
jgi:glycosyltransferase involved in cell wall biosynthesis